jgi:hypothetical protein
MRALLIFYVVILRSLTRRRNHNHNHNRSHNRSIPPPATPVIANRRSERLMDVGSVGGYVLIVFFDRV